MFPNPRTQECERDVERILYLNQLVDRLLDSYNNAANVTKSHIHAAGASPHLERLTVQTTPMKRGRGKYLQTRKQRTWKKVYAARECGLPSIELDDSKREALVDSTKIMINFVKT